MRKLLLLVLMCVLLVNTAYSQTLIQTHIDESPYSTNTNAGQYGLVWEINTTGYKLVNVTYIGGHSHTDSCLYNASDNKLLKCCDITVNTASCFDYEMIVGETYFVAGLRNGSVQATKYKSGGVGYPDYPTETLDILKWTKGLTLGTTFPPNPADFADNSFWISVEHMDFEVIAAGGGGSNKDFINVSLSSNTTSTSSISLVWNVSGNYSYSELFNYTNLVYNGSDTFYTHSGLQNVTTLNYSINVYWNTSLSNTTGYFQITTGQTLPYSLNDIYLLLEEHNNFVEGEIKMIWVAIVYMVFVIGGLYLIRLGNLIAGSMLYLNSIGLDFLFSAVLYNDYVGSIATGFYGSLIALFIVSLWFWVIIKIGLLFLIRSKTYKI